MELHTKKSTNVRLTEKEMDELTDEILKDIIAKEKERDLKNKEIIANGCPHSEKENHTGLFSGVEFKFCGVCNKQFDLNDNPL